MSKLKVDLTGKRFGTLTVLERDFTPGPGNIKWVCRCDCGTVRSIWGSLLKSGKYTACGGVMCISQLDHKARIKRLGYEVCY